MANLKQLTVDDEFSLLTTVIMKNWFELERFNHYSNNCREFYDLLISGTESVIAQDWKYELEDFADQIQDYIEDNSEYEYDDDSKSSCVSAARDLVNYYRLIKANDRENIDINHLSDKRSIFTFEEYNPRMIERVDKDSYEVIKGVPYGLFRDNQNFSLNTVRNVAESSCMDIDSSDEEADDGWETVVSRKKR